MCNNIACVKTEQCCGCDACYNKCPVNAISMQEDNEGFLKPIIDEINTFNIETCKVQLDENYSNGHLKFGLKFSQKRKKIIKKYLKNFGDKK